MSMPNEPIPCPCTGCDGVMVVHGDKWGKPYLGCTECTMTYGLLDIHGVAMSDYDTNESLIAAYKGED